MNIKPSHGRLLLLTCASLVLTSATWADIEIYLIGDLPGGLTYSRATHISHDGEVVAGTSGSGAGDSSEGFVWTREMGLQPIGVVQTDDHRFSWVNAISGDGSTVVGYGTGQFGFRWRQDTGIRRLGTVTGASASSAYGTTFDGSIVVGVASGPLFGYEAFRWSAQTGNQALGDGPLYDDSRGYAVSDDGRVIVGQADFPIGDGSRDEELAAVWIDGEMLRLNPPHDDRLSIAQHVSADGNTIYGLIGANAESTHAIWDENLNMRELGLLGGSYGCSPSGWFLLGGGGPGAYIWDEANGMRRLDTILRTHGVELPDNYTMSSVRGMSADHRVVCGTGGAGDIPDGFVVYNLPLPGDLDGDMTGDGIVDVLDWKPLQYCMQGPGVPASGVCTLADFDHDGDVDLRDIAVHYQPYVVEPCPLRADMTKDCVVDLLDASHLIWACVMIKGGPASEAQANCDVADLDHSGAVDLRDVAIFQRLYAQEAE